MRHILFFILVSIVFARSLTAQCNGFVLNTTGDGNAYSVSSVIDADDNIYTVGYFSGTMTVGTTILKTTALPVGIFLTKIDKSGQFIFTKLIAETNGVDVQSPNITVGTNEVLIEGVVHDTLLIGGTRSHKQGKSHIIFIMKLSKDGNTSWSKTGYYNDPLNLGGWGAIASDRNGGAFMATNFRDSLIIGNDQLIAGGSLPVLLLHADGNGNFTWLKFSGLAGGYARKLIFNGTDVVLAGEVNGGIKFDDKATGGGAITNIYRLFVVSFSGSDGTTQWLWSAQPNAASPSGGAHTILSDLKCDRANNIYITGYMSDSVQFDNIKLVGRSAMYIAKLNPTGSIIWAQKKSGHVSGRPEYGFMAIDSNQYIYFAGTFVDSTYFGTQKYSGIKGGSWFLAHFIDSSHWDHVTIGQNTGAAYPQSVMSTSRDSFTVVVSFLGNSTSFKGLTATNGSDTNSGVYNLAWFGACTLGNSVDENLSRSEGCTIFPNPATNKLNIKFKNNYNGGIKYTIVNELGEEVVRNNAISVNGNFEISFDTKMITSGIYILKIQIGDQSFLQKFMIRQ